MKQQIRKVQSLIKQAGYLQCPICYQEYDDGQKYPMIICPQQHSICKHCALNVLFKFGDIAGCPQCRATINKNSMIRFRYLQELHKKSELMKGKQSPTKTEIDLSKDYQKQWREQKQKNEWLLKQNEQKEKQIKKLKAENIEQEDIIIKLKNQLRQMREKFQEGPLISAKDWVDANCKSYSNLIFNGSMITSRGDSDIFSKIKLNGVCSFTATFTKINGVVGLGVIDSEYKQGNFGTNRLFYGCDGFCFDGTQQKFNQGLGFKVGQTITVFVDLTKGVIQWRVGTKMRHQVKAPILKQTKINWVPRIYLGQRDNSVDLNL